MATPRVNQILMNKVGGAHELRGKKAKRSRQKQDFRKQVNQY